MTCQYTTNFSDFRNAQKLYLQRKGLVRYLLLVWLVPFIGLSAAIFVLVYVFLQHNSLNPAIDGLLTFVATVGLLQPLIRPVNYRRLYKQMKRGRGEDEPLEFGVEGDELIARIPGISEGRFFRKAVLELAEDDNVVLLFITKRNFLLLPKRTIPEPDLQRVRDWFHSPSTS